MMVDSQANYLIPFTFKCRDPQMWWFIVADCGWNMNLTRMSRFIILLWHRVGIRRSQLSLRVFLHICKKIYLFFLLFFISCAWDVNITHLFSTAQSAIKYNLQAHEGNLSNILLSLGGWLNCRQTYERAWVLGQANSHTMLL